MENFRLHCDEVDALIRRAVTGARRYGRPTTAPIHLRFNLSLMLSCRTPLDRRRRGEQLSNGSIANDPRLTRTRQEGCFTSRKALLGIYNSAATTARDLSWR
ncbi:hypothetical protein MRX96_011591 [Rhipicephalus microplus]